jgi:hypothetical protein
MAKKARKKSAAKGRKKTKAVARKKSRSATKRRKVRKARPKTLGEDVSRAYRTVVDTIKDTDRLRNKLEPPGTSETE